VSLQDDISKHSEKSEKLSKLQSIIWGDLGSPDPTGFEAMQRSMKAKEEALEEYWDLCEADESIAGLMQLYDFSRKDLNDVYLKMIDVGIGQWVKGHFVALSALAYREPFHYLMESEERGRWDGEDFKKVAVDILHYFREEIPQGELYKQYDSSDSSLEEQKDLCPFCGYCGKKNQPSYKFCTKCGKPLDNNSEPNLENLDTKLDEHIQSQEDNVSHGEEDEQDRPTWDRFIHLVKGHFKGKLTERLIIGSRDFWEHYEAIHYKLSKDEMAIWVDPLTLASAQPAYAHKGDATKWLGIFILIIGFALLLFSSNLSSPAVAVGALLFGVIVLMCSKTTEDMAKEFSGKLILGLVGINSNKGMANLAANYMAGVVQLKGSSGLVRWPQHPSCVLSGKKKNIPEKKDSALTEYFDTRKKLSSEVVKPKKIKPAKISSFFKAAQGTIFLSVLLVLFVCGIYLAYQGKGTLYPILKDSLGMDLAKEISVEQFNQHGRNGLGLLLIGAFWGFLSGLISYWRIGENFSKRLMWGVIGSVYLSTMYGLAGFSFSFAFGGGWLGGFLGAGLGWLVGYGAYQTKNKVLGESK
jgi:hypothetical protein